MTPIALSAELVTEGPVSRYQALNCRPYRPSAAQAQAQARRAGAVDRQVAQKEPAQNRVLRSLGGSWQGPGLLVRCAWLMLGTFAVLFAVLVLALAAWQATERQLWRWGF